jgi:microcystin-dependent protein
MRITRQGRVGIWTTNPSTALDVNGTVTATSFSGPLTGNVTGNVTGIASGNIKQGGGTSQTTNTIYMGWSASSKLRVQVDSTDFGSNWPIDISGTAAKVADGAVTQASTSNMLVPAGAVMAFAMNSAPTGWLACNGQAVDRSGPSGYPTLFAAIGTTYGVGNNSTTFNLPNLQGIFVRGSGSQTVGGVSYSRTHATTQNDALQNISGTVGQFDAAFGTTVATGAFTTTQVTRTTGGGGSGKYLTADFDASRVARADVETRPVNIAMLYCIKI